MAVLRHFSLAATTDAEARRVFADQMEHSLKRRLASQPSAMRSLGGTFVLTKQSAS
jgi:hypothetical protein